MGADFGAVWCLGRVVWGQFACQPASAGAGGAIGDHRGLHGLYDFTSNPFERLDFPPFDGTDLNPLLQDPGLAFHPPFLYLGYVGLSMAFSFAIAALIEGRVDAAWGRWVRPWTLAAWVFPDHWDRHGFVVGLLRAWLGRVLVLGPGGKRQPYAVAVCRSAVAFRHCGGKARNAEKLDHPAWPSLVLASR
jgi:hypothetical protein